MSGETRQSYVAWLIECHTVQGAQWLVSSLGEAEWTADALAAFRFETEADAHHHINQRGGTMAFTPSGCPAFPMDHQFITVPPAPVPAPPPESPDVGTGGRETESPSIAAYRIAAKRQEEQDAADAEMGAALVAALANTSATGHDWLCISPAGTVMHCIGAPPLATQDDATRALARALAHRGTA